MPLLPCGLVHYQAELPLFKPHLPLYVQQDRGQATTLQPVIKRKSNWPFLLALTLLISSPEVFILKKTLSLLLHQEYRIMPLLLFVLVGGKALWTINKYPLVSNWKHIIRTDFLVILTRFRFPLSLSLSLSLLLSFPFLMRYQFPPFSFADAFPIKQTALIFILACILSLHLFICIGCTPHSPCAKRLLIAEKLTRCLTPPKKG